MFHTGGMFSDWMWTSWTQAGLVLLSVALIIPAVIGIIRLIGLRSLSKMSSFDFVVTVAIGSIVATTVATPTPVANGALGVLALLSFQAVISLLRSRTTLEKVVDNTPVLLMRDGEMIEHALQRERVARSDVIAKLREANVLQLSQVRAVVLETTGDISVLHGSSALDDVLLEGVREVEPPAP